MTASTPEEVRERILAVALEGGVAASGYTAEDCDDCVVEPDGLPMLIVATRGTRREQSNRDKRLVTTDYELLLLVVEFDPQSRESNDEARRAAEAVYELLPDYFADHAPRLEVNNQPMDGIWRTDAIRDDGPKTIEWGGKHYYDILYTLPVVTQRARS